MTDYDKWRAWAERRDEIMGRILEKRWGVGYDDATEDQLDEADDEARELAGEELK